MFVTIAAMVAAAAAPTGLLDRIVARLQAAGTIPREDLERMIGRRLAVVSASDAYRIYEAEVDDAGLALTVELRAPVPGGAATAGPLTIVRVRSGCRDRRTLLARYAPLVITDTPHGHSLDEPTSWSRTETGGRLSFGFAERSPDCLASIAFDGTPAGRGGRSPRSP